MIFCENCGKQLSDGVKFCGGCGTAIAGNATPACANCGKQLDAGQKFCDGCGKSTSGNLPPTRQPAPPVFAPITTNTTATSGKHFRSNNDNESDALIDKKSVESSAIQKGANSNSLMSQMGIGETGSKILNVLGTIAKYFWRFIKWGVKWGIRNT